MGLPLSVIAVSKQQTTKKKQKVKTDISDKQLFFLKHKKMWQLRNQNQD